MLRDEIFEQKVSETELGGTVVMCVSALLGAFFMRNALCQLVW